MADDVEAPPPITVLTATPVNGAGPLGELRGVTLADLDGDTHLDIVRSGAVSGSPRLDVQFGSADGTFSDPVSRSLPGPVFGSVAVGDVNNDLRPDIVVGRRGTAGFAVALTDANGQPGELAAAGGTAVTNKVALAHMNDDAFLDVVSTSGGFGETFALVHVFLGDGTGAFTQAAQVSVSNEPFDIATGDIDGDDDIDVAVAARSGNQVHVLKNDGSGDLTADPALNIGGSARRVMMADFDSDTDLDLAVAGASGACTFNTMCLQLWRNNGSGSFTLAAADKRITPTVDWIPVTPSEQAVTDVDGDGELDILLATDGGADIVTIAYGDGAGGFTFMSVSTAGSDNWSGFGTPPAWGVLAGRIGTDDTRTDLVVSHQTGFDNATFRSRQVVVFGDPDNARDFITTRLVPLQTSDEARGLTLTDVDGDGDDDLVFWSNGRLYRALNDGNGNFGSNVQIADLVTPGVRSWCFPDQLIATDLDGDDDPDIVCVGSSGGAYALNNGTDTWDFGPLNTESDGTYSGADTGDFDGDGVQEIVTWSWHQPVSLPSARFNVYRLNTTTNTYEPHVTIPLGDSEPSPQRGVAIADFNGDDKLDIAARVGADVRGPAGTPERLVVVPGNGDGTFGEHITSAPNFPPTTQLVAGDFDYDGIVDLVAKGTSGRNSSQIDIASGNGDGTFAPSRKYDVFIGFSEEIQMQDVNGDSLPDALVKSDLALSLLAAKGNGDYAAQQDLVRVDDLVPGFAVGDIDGDARLEFLMVRDRTTLMVVRTNGSIAGGAADLVPTAFEGPEAIVAGEEAELTWTVRNDGEGAARGPWIDRFTLLHENGNTVAAEFRHSDDVRIEPGASKTFTASIRVPAVTIGTGYRWRLQLNGRATMPESLRDNNTITDEDDVTVDMKFLPRAADTVVTLPLDTKGANVWTLAPDDKPVAIDVVGDPGVRIDLYGGDGRVPTRTSYDLRNELGATSSLLIPPGGGSHTSYLRVETRDPITDDVPVTLRARVIDVGELGTVSPNRVALGVTTFQITAHALGADPFVEFVRGDTRIEADEVEVDGDTVWARADFSGAPAGTYALEVRTVGIGQLEGDPDYEPDPENIGQPPINGESAYKVNTARLDDAVVVDGEADPGRLELRLSAPAEVRAGRDFDLTVTYENTGSTDVPSPVLVVEVGSEPGAKLGIEGDPFRTNHNIQILGAPTNGPADRLRPGVRESVRVTVLAPRGQDFVTLPVTVATADEVTTAGPDWEQIVRAAGIPEDAPVFAETVAVAQEHLGPNWKSYADALRATARVGNGDDRVIRSVPRLIELALSLGASQDAAPDGAPLAPRASRAARSTAPISLPGDRGASALPGFVFPSEPPDQTVQNFYGDGDPRNWSRARALTFWNAMQAIVQAGSLNPITRGTTGSTAVFADHLDHFFNGDGSPRHYPLTDPFSQQLRGDPAVAEWIETGPAMKRKLNALAKEAAAGLECEEAVNITIDSQITAPNNGIGLDFKTFNAVYGVGKIPRADLKGHMTVFKDDKGGLLYFGDVNITLFDKYTWVYVEEGDPYQEWSTKGFAIFEDKNFMSWYLEHYGLAKAFEMTIELGSWDIFGTIAPGSCEEPPEEQPPPEEPPLKDPKAGPYAIRNIGATDPNDKQSSGAGAPGAIRPGDAIDYTIRFENIETATAPAQEVFVDDVLAPELDLSTLELTGMGFGQVKVDVPPGQQSFETVVDAPTDNYPVRITADLDPVTRTLSWVFRSFDEETLELPAEASAGFLPPNDETGRGQGWASFRVHHVDGLGDADSWTNNASIVFDVNDAIITNDARVTIDTENPTAHVLPLAEESTTPFDVTWEGIDTVGPVTPFDVYVSTDGGPWELWLDDTVDTSASFDGEVGKTYGFAVVGTDGVGRTSALPGEPDTTTTVIEGGSGTTTTTTSTSTTTTSTTSTTTTSTTSTSTTTTTVPTTTPTTVRPTAPPPSKPSGAVVLGSDGGVFTLGNASFHGSLANKHVVGKPVAIARTQSGKGYIAVTDRGAVYAFGNATFHGALTGTPLRAPIVDIALSKTGRGYWLVAADGGVFAFGDARFRGSAANLPLRSPIVAITRSPSGNGYTLFASDGGVFTYGDARYRGSAATLRLNAPIVDVVPASNGGYTLIARDGGTFAYGTKFVGSLAGRRPAAQVVGAVPSGNGFMLLERNGNVTAFNTKPIVASERLQVNLFRSGPVAIG